MSTAFKTRAEKLGKRAPTPAAPAAVPVPATTGHSLQHHKALRLRPEYRSLTRTDLRVLDAVIVHADEHGVAFPGFNVLGAFCPGTANKNISKSIKKLERLETASTRSPACPPPARTTGVTTRT
jgi:hypothetical protein